MSLKLKHFCGCVAMFPLTSEIASGSRREIGCWRSSQSRCNGPRPGISPRSYLPHQILSLRTQSSGLTKTGSGSGCGVCGRFASSASIARILTIGLNPQDRAGATDCWPPEGVTAICESTSISFVSVLRLQIRDWPAGDCRHASRAFGLLSNSSIPVPWHRSRIGASAWRMNCVGCQMLESDRCSHWQSLSIILSPIPHIMRRCSGPRCSRCGAGRGCYGNWRPDPIVSQRAPPPEHWLSFWQFACCWSGTAWPKPLVIFWESRQY